MLTRANLSKCWIAEGVLIPNSQNQLIDSKFWLRNSILTFNLEEYIVTTFWIGSRQHTIHKREYDVMSQFNKLYPMLNQIYYYNSKVYFVETEFGIRALSAIRHFAGLALVNIRSPPLVLNHPCHNQKVYVKLVIKAA